MIEKLILLTAVVAGFTLAKAQPVTDLSGRPFAKISEVDIVPSYPGGVEAFYEYFQKSYKHTASLPSGTKGKILVRFVVERDGTLSNVVCLRDMGHGTGKEAVRVVKASPKWKPGYIGEQPARVQLTLPIMLKI